MLNVSSSQACLAEHTTKSLPTCLSPQSYYWAGFQSKPTMVIWSLIGHLIIWPSGPPSPSRVLGDGDRDSLADPPPPRQVTQLIWRPGPPAIWTAFVTVRMQVSGHHFKDH